MKDEIHHHAVHHFYDGHQQVPVSPEAQLWAELRRGHPDLTTSELFEKYKKHFRKRLSDPAKTEP